MLQRLWISFEGWLEYQIVTRLVPKRVGPVMRLVFKLPVLFYRMGLGGLIGKKILLLITTGRRSGKPRTTALEYSRIEQTGAIFLMTGWSGNSDWFRNALACPRVHLRIGREKITGQAVPATDEDVVQVMEEVLRIYPKAARTWSRHSGAAFDGTRASLLQMAKAIPSLLVYPDADTMS